MHETITVTPLTVESFSSSCIIIIMITGFTITIIGVLVSAMQGARRPQKAFAKELLGMATVW